MPTCLGNPGFHRAYRYLELGRDLRVVQVTDIAKHHGCDELRSTAFQLFQRVQQIQPRTRDNAGRPRIGTLKPLHSDLFARPGFQRAVGLAGAVGHHDPHPGVKAGAALETRDLASHPQQGVLARFFGVLSARQKTGTVFQQVRRDTNKQLVQRPGIPSGRATSQFFDLFVPTHSHVLTGSRGPARNVRHTSLVVVPESIGRYRISRRIGSGAFATVWLAEDDVLLTRVAIKVLAENWSDRLDVRRRFIDEARVLRRADSDRLVRVFDIGELPDGRPYFVMTFAEGGTLADRLSSGPLDPGTTRAIAVEIAACLVVLHGNGIIHRDLTPSNILFGADGTGNERILLADLGLAKATAHASKFTLPAGSQGYMAPEQAQFGGAVDERADVYGFGALLYHMLAGEVPGETLAELPPPMDHIVRRSLETDPDRRWPTAAALLDALENSGTVSELRAEPAAPQQRASWYRRLTRRQKVSILTTTVSLALVAALLGIFLHPPAKTIRVSDASRTISVSVPATWAQQVQASGWDPRLIRLHDDHSPGLATAPNLAAWRDHNSRTPGLFIGVSKELGKLDSSNAFLPGHEECRRVPDRKFQSEELVGHVARWINCGGETGSFSEALLARRDGSYGLYVQVKQTGSADLTTKILASLRLAKPKTGMA